MNSSFKFWASSVSLLGLFQSTITLPAQVVPKPTMNILVIAGEGTVNNVNKREPHDISVQVRDGNRNPLPNATVTFTLPSQGPSGEFFDRSRTLTLTADEQGRATARGLRSNRVAGKFELLVGASYKGESVRIAVTQFNMLVKNEKSGSGKWVAILAIAGGAAAGGAYAAMHKSNSTSPAAVAGGPALIGITPGTGSITPPR